MNNTKASYTLPIYGDVFKHTIDKSNKNLSKNIADKVVDLLETNKIPVGLSSIEDSPIGIKLWLENNLPYFDNTLQKLKKCLPDLNLRFDYGISLGTELNHKGAFLLFSKNKDQREVINLGSVLKTDSFWNLYQNSNTKVALGTNDKNEPVILNIEDFPHALISGTTGSGKSTCMNVIITSIIATVPPNKCKFVLIDPKAVELEKFKFASHNLFSSQVLTTMTDIQSALWEIVNIRKKRQKIFAENKVSNIQQYNSLTNKETMPFIIVLIDELGQVCDNNSQRALHDLASLGRALGIHLICATQKPSANLLPTNIRDNFSQIAFKVTDKNAARVTVKGADKLIGRGDGLYYDKNSLSYRNFQCAYVSDEEIEACIKFSNDQLIN